MCGLIGARIQQKSGFETVKEKIREALNTLYHRGPDATGLFFKESHGLILGHTRLSIFDLSETGSQPMSSRSGQSLAAAGCHIRFQVGGCRPPVFSMRLRASGKPS